MVEKTAEISLSASTKGEKWNNASFLGTKKCSLIIKRL